MQTDKVGFKPVIAYKKLVPIGEGDFKSPMYPAIWRDGIS